MISHFYFIWFFRIKKSKQYRDCAKGSYMKQRSLCFCGNIIISVMSEQFIKDLLLRTKKQLCPQDNCKSSNEDNIEFICLESGLCCSQCIINTPKIQSSIPIQQHVLTLKRFLNLVWKQWKQYSELKNKQGWGPNLIAKQKEQICSLLESLERDVMKGIMDVINSVQQAAKDSIQQIKNISKDSNLDKLLELVEEENEIEQERTNVTKELSSLSKTIESVDGTFKINNQYQLTKKNEAVMIKFRTLIEASQKTLTDLIEVQKRTLKVLIN